jgi:ABC-2 type transport system ATP-binding protein
MIEAHGLGKTYKSRDRREGKGGLVAAVRGVDLHVEAKEIVGLLGPNGAGKTTTLRMLTTLLTPTSGRARIAGVDLLQDPVGVRRRIGYVAQAGTTDPEALVGEELVDQARLYGIARDDATTRARALLEQLDLPDTWTKKCGTLSGGQRRRVDIAMGLIHRPALVFLDEPSTGLDPQSRANLWGHIRSIRERLGTAVLLTTHYMDEADALCDRIVIIDHGEVVATGTPRELKQRVGGDALVLTLEAASQVDQARALTQQMAPGTTPEAHGATLRIAMANGGALLPKLLLALAEAHVGVCGVELRSPTLDDVFLTLTGRSLREAA